MRIYSILRNTLISLLFVVFLGISWKLSGTRDFYDASPQSARLVALSGDDPLSEP